MKTLNLIMFILIKKILYKKYLIPNIKSKRSLIFKPSQVVYNKGVLIDYKYILDNGDYIKKSMEFFGDTYKINSSVITKKNHIYIM